MSAFQRSSKLMSTQQGRHNINVNVSTLLVDTDAGFDDFLALAALQNTSKEFTQSKA
jgi:hypothetical protein